VNLDEFYLEPLQGVPVTNYRENKPSRLGFGSPSTGDSGYCAQANGKAQVDFVTVSDYPRESCSLQYLSHYLGLQHVLQHSHRGLDAALDCGLFLLSRGDAAMLHPLLDEMQRAPGKVHIIRHI